MSITPLPRPVIAKVPTSTKVRLKICYLVVLNKKFLTLLASDLLLQIEQALSQIGKRDQSEPHCNTVDHSLS
ncbi:hypothetical protein EAG18_03455 [Pseudoalteromonas sp. J010]|nr:hypothetical protein EAG18_03455 [Pseudoalteromonas sp. J010]